MEEKAVLVNIATILAKDIGLDKQFNFKRAVYPVHQFQKFLEDDDDNMDVFMYKIQQRKSAALKKRNADRRRKISRPKPELKVVDELSTKDFERNFNICRSTFRVILI